MKYTLCNLNTCLFHTNNIVLKLQVKFMNYHETDIEMQK